METLVNKVAESGIITLNLEDYYPKEENVAFDLKDFLFMGLILKEKDYRAALLNTDWNLYLNKNVSITCTADAVIPMWANMLAASYLEPVAKNIVFGPEETLIEKILLKNISSINPQDYTDKRVVIKGCGELPITESAYVEITRLLKPFVKSIMYGEPCSTVPIYKKK